MSSIFSGSEKDKNPQDFEEHIRCRYTASLLPRSCQGTYTIPNTLNVKIFDFADVQALDIGGLLSILFRIPS